MLRLSPPSIPSRIHTSRAKSHIIRGLSLCLRSEGRATRHAPGKTVGCARAVNRLARTAVDKAVRTIRCVAPGLAAQQKLAHCFTAKDWQQPSHSSMFYSNELLNKKSPLGRNMVSTLPAKLQTLPGSLLLLLLQALLSAERCP